MEPDESLFEAIPTDMEPGMNLISVDFDLVMVNRPNERLYGKPMVALLGKKCYREFEKRDEPCPHCPGRLALATGEAHETETIGLRDDGTRFFARIRAVPVAGPHDQPTGFIEVVEDITEQKRAESLATIYADLRAVLQATHSVSRALRETFEAALRVEGIDSGCIFSVDQVTGDHNLVHQRNIPMACLAPLAEVSQGKTGNLPAGMAGAPKAVEIVPVLHGGEVVATLAMGASTYPEIPPTLRAGLQSLGAAAGGAVSRIRAERSRGDAVADLEALIAVNPVPTWVLDARNRVTMWNSAAERLFGWRATEVVGRPSPLTCVREGHDTPATSSGDPRSTALIAKDGTPVEVTLSTAPFRDVVGDASTVVVMAEDLSTHRRLAEAESRLAGLLAASAEHPQPRAGLGSGDVAAGPGARVLIVDPVGSWGRELADILARLGYLPTMCASTSETAAILTGLEAKERPFALVVVDLVTPGQISGLGQTAVLRALGLKAPVIACSDADVRGHQQHGIAAVVKRPFQADAVAQVVRGVLQQLV